MARIIQTTSKVNIGIKVINHYVTEGDYSENSFNIDDMVENFQFVNGTEVVALNGRLSRVTTEIIPNAKKVYKDLTDPIAERLNVLSVDVDHSAESRSAITIIPAKEILEYDPIDEVRRVEILPIMSVDLRVRLTDGTESAIKLTEGKEIMGVSLLGPTEFTPTDIKVKSFVYTIDKKTMAITVSGIILDDGNDTMIDLLRIKSCGRDGIVLEPDGNTITDILASVNDGVTPIGLSIPEGIYSEELSLGGNIVLKGNNNVAANKGSRCTDDISEKETVLTDPITCVEGSDITLTGVTLTEDSLINISNAKSVTFKNCKIVGINPDKAKSYLITGGTFVKGVEPDGPVKVMFDGCYFGANPIDGSNKIYNGLELNFKIADGSYIKNCYFSKDCVGNNIINIYAIEDGARITISDNVFEMSGTAIRIGTVGDSGGIINIAGNTFNETLDGEYAGLVLFQPYGNMTKSMSNIKVYISNTVPPAGTTNVPLWYAFMNAKDTQMNSSLWPELYVDGKKETITLGDESTVLEANTSV